jgi:hypothetical protein
MKYYINCLGNANSKAFISAEYLETHFNGLRFQASSEKQMKTAFFWAITQHIVGIPYRRFGARNVGKELPLPAA